MKVLPRDGILFFGDRLFFRGCQWRLLFAQELGGHISAVGLFGEVKPCAQERSTYH